MGGSIPSMYSESSYVGIQMEASYMGMHTNPASIYTQPLVRCEGPKYTTPIQPFLAPSLPPFLVSASLCPSQVSAAQPRQGSAKQSGHGWSSPSDIPA